MTTETKFIAGAGILTLILIVAASFFLGKQKSPEAQDTKVADGQQLTADAKNTTGNPNAPVKIVEFGDYQCPACAAAEPIVKNVLAQNGESIYFVFRNFPLSTHKNSQITAKAAEASSLQGKFWEMHDILYEKQNDWANSDNPQEILDQYAQSIGLDIDKFHEDMQSVTGIVNSDYALGNNVGVNSTPTFFINGQKYPGVIDQAQFLQIIDGIVQSQPARESTTQAQP